MTRTIVFTAVAGRGREYPTSVSPCTVRRCLRSAFAVRDGGRLGGHHDPVPRFRLTAAAVDTFLVSDTGRLRQSTGSVRRGGGGDRASRIRRATLAAGTRTERRATGPVALVRRRRRSSVFVVSRPAPTSSTGPGTACATPLPGPAPRCTPVVRRRRRRASRATWRRGPGPDGSPPRPTRGPPRSAPAGSARQSRTARARPGRGTRPRRRVRFSGTLVPPTRSSSSACRPRSLDAVCSHFSSGLVRLSLGYNIRTRNAFSKTDLLYLKF